MIPLKFYKKLSTQDSFATQVSLLEQYTEKNWFEIENELRRELIEKRIFEIVKVAQYTRHYKSVIGETKIQTIKDFKSLIPPLSREEYTNYMMYENKLGYAFEGSKSDWFSMTSGGSCGIPTVSWFAPRDTLSTSQTVARNYIYFLRENGLTNFWETYPYHKVGLQAATWGESGLCYLSGKPFSFEHASAIFSAFHPEVINGTAYSIQKLFELISSRYKNLDELRSSLERLRYFMYGAEFLTDRAIENIRLMAPNAKPLSRYGASQAYGTIALQQPEMTKGKHLVFDSIVYVEILDENNEPVPNGQLGEVTITSLHAYEQPILRFKLGDLGKLEHNEQGGENLTLFGRMDGIAIFNSQKIPVQFVLNHTIHAISSFYNKIRLNGVGQIRRNKDGNYSVAIEGNVKQSKTIIRYKQELTAMLREKIAEIAKIMFLPPQRASEGYNLQFVIVPLYSLPRSGLSNKVRPFIDDNSE